MRRRASTKKRLLGWLAVAAALWGLAGCEGSLHLHPQAGKSYRAMMSKQGKGRPASLEMSGEDAELAMSNLTKKFKAADFKQSKTNFLLPLSR